MDMDTSLVERVRSFNRTMTERIGLLNDHYPGRNHPLGEARLLWEIGTKGASVRSLRSRLGLDSGYVSRLLRSLEKQGLVVVRPGESDRRVRYVRLTRAGLCERAELDRRAEAFAYSLLEPLNDSQRSKLTAAMAQVERLLAASMVEILITDPTSPAAGWCFEQYYTELGQRFDVGFDPALSISAHAHELILPTGLLLVARLCEKPIGCGALKFHEAAPADIKRMWIAPEARGLGLGRRMLLALEHHAREAEAETLHLETNRVLTEAIQLYQTCGYQEVAPFNDESYAHHWFEKHL